MLEQQKLLGAFLKAPGHLSKQKTLVPLPTNELVRKHHLHPEEGTWVRLAHRSCPGALQRGATTAVAMQEQSMLAPHKAEDQSCVINPLRQNNSEHLCV